MQAEARRGFTPLEQYMELSEPEQIAAARHLAYARTLWRDLDLTPNSQPLYNSGARSAQRSRRVI